MVWRVLVALAGLLFCSVGDAHQWPPQLVPFPRKITTHGPIDVPSHLHIVADSIDIQPEGWQLQTELKAVGFNQDSLRTAGVVELKLTINNASLQPSAYQLDNTGSDAWRITGGSARAVFWGTRTLLQLLNDGPVGGKTLAVRIEDNPQVEYRSLMLDCARVTFTAGWVIDVIKRMASLKLSVLHLHLSDTEGYKLPSMKYPHLPSPDAFSIADVESIVAAAKAYHIDLVPEIDLPGKEPNPNRDPNRNRNTYPNPNPNLPGHSGWLTKKIPGLVSPKCSGGDTWCPINFSPSGLNQSLAIVQDLLGEVFDLFNTSVYHHLGTDEVYPSPGFAAYCACQPNGTFLRNGSTQLNFTACSGCMLEAKAGYHAFINRMHRWVKAHGRQSIVWEGFDPDPSKLGEEAAVESIDKDIIVSPFDVAHHDGWDRTPIDYFTAGYRIINSAWAPLYVCPGNPSPNLNPYPNLNPNPRRSTLDSRRYCTVGSDSIWWPERPDATRHMAAPP